MWPQVVEVIKQHTAGMGGGGMDLNNLKPVEKAFNGTCPALFLHAIDDELIAMEHTEKNFEAYGGQNKNVAYFEGDHNSMRPQDTMQ